MAVVMLFGDRGNEKRQEPSHPEQLPVTETELDKPGPETVEDAAFIHRIDLGDRDDQGQQQLAVFKCVMADGLLGNLREAPHPCY